MREECADPQILQTEINLASEAATQISEHLIEGRRVLGKVPTQHRVIIERFFDESGGMQMVLHAPFGGRINRAWGLALRKRFCRGFGFELQAAANEEAIVISLGLQHSFPLADVFDYLAPETAQKTLTQAVLDQPMFESRWRWNATRSLVLERFQNGKPVPPAILRMRAGDLLAASFPAAVACPENLPPGDLPIPMEHPLVRQTIDDCLTESTDIVGLIQVLRGLRDGSIERVAIDTPEPSAFARGIFRPVLTRSSTTRRWKSGARKRSFRGARSTPVRPTIWARSIRMPWSACGEEAWPEPESAEEVHDALQWMGFVTDEEAGGLAEWLAVLSSQQRVRHDAGRWSAVDGPTEPKKILLGRLEALGPIAVTIRASQWTGRKRHCSWVWNTRARSFARGSTAARPGASGGSWPASSATRSIASAAKSSRLRLPSSCSFSAAGSTSMRSYRLDGPHGVGQVLRQLAGFEIPARAWESQVLASRVRDYRREWLDELTLSGEFAWGRLWGGGASPIRVTPLSFIPRDDLDAWLALAPPAPREGLSGFGRRLAQAALCPGRDVPATSAENHRSTAGLRRHGPGRPGGPRPGDLRFVRLAAAIDHAPLASPPPAEIGRPLELLPRRQRGRESYFCCEHIIGRFANKTPDPFVFGACCPPIASPHRRRLPPHARARADSDFVVARWCASIAAWSCAAKSAVAAS